MPRRLFKRYMPDPESIRSQKSLRFLGKLTHDPNLWHLNRHSVSRAMAAGLFAAFIPMPMQMLLAAGLAVWIRSNLPISVGLVWLTNPITMPGLLLHLQAGRLVDAGAAAHPAGPSHLGMDQPGLSSLWQPFLLGSVVCGIIAAILGYALTMLYWRWWVQRSWSRRCRQRRERIAAK